MGDSVLPWSPSEVKRHNKSAPPSKWAKIANKVLSEGKTDESAIRIANAATKKMRD